MVDKAPTLRAALVGKSISRSLTPAMHEAEGRALGLDYVYNSIDTDVETNCDLSLSSILEQAQHEGFVGLNITHPYKIEILEYLDDLSDNARKLGAANTVVFQAGKRIGYNTDFTGFVISYRQSLADAPNDRVLLLGAGGAGVAVGFALIECGIRELLVYDTDTIRAHGLVTKLKAHHPTVDIYCSQSLAQAVSSGLCGIVNATPMGMADYPGTAIPLDLLSPYLWVTEIVYFPYETKLLAHARALGCRVMSGAGMAVWQAVHAFKLFTGHSPNPDRMASTFSRQLSRSERNL